MCRSVARDDEIIKLDISIKVVVVATLANYTKSKSYNTIKIYL